MEIGIKLAISREKVSSMYLMSIPSLETLTHFPMVMESLNLREIGTFMMEISLTLELKVKEKFTQHKTASLSKELSTKILNLPQVL